MSRGWAQGTVTSLHRCGLSTWPALPNNTALGSKKEHLRASVWEPQSSLHLALDGMRHNFHCSLWVGSKSLRPARIQEERE